MHTGGSFIWKSNKLPQPLFPVFFSHNHLTSPFLSYPHSSPHLPAPSGCYSSTMTVLTGDVLDDKSARASQPVPDGVVLPTCPPLPEEPLDSCDGPFLCFSHVSSHIVSVSFSSYVFCVRSLGVLGYLLQAPLTSYWGNFIYFLDSKCNLGRGLPNLCLSDQTGLLSTGSMIHPDTSAWHLQGGVLKARLIIGILPSPLNQNLPCPPAERQYHPPSHHPELILLPLDFQIQSLNALKPTLSVFLKSAYLWGENCKEVVVLAARGSRFKPHIYHLLMKRT